MRVLVACEWSGTVRDAFRRSGHEAWSCDLLGPDELPDEFRSQTWPNYHLEGDCLNFLSEEWDLLIAFPPCTHLAVSGARYFAQKKNKQQEALDFVQALMDAPIPRIAIENPVGVISTKIRKPDQIIQPWQFGHGETKTTCLWLKCLPKLEPTNVVEGREQRVWRMGPSPERARLRGKTYLGIAEAMAEQWGRLAK